MKPPYPQAVQSPLPDSSALEAGLVADDRLPRGCVASSDVRNLMLEEPISGRLAYADICQTPRFAPDAAARSFYDDVKCRSIFEDYAADDNYVPSPTEKGTYAASLLDLYSRSPNVDLETGIVIFDSDHIGKERLPTLAHRRRNKRRGCSERDARCQVLTCVALTAFLSTLVAAYISQAVPPRTLHPALHTVFIVTILATTVLLAFYAARLTKLTTTVPRHLWPTRPPKSRHQRHRRHRRWPSTPHSSSSRRSITSQAGLLRTPSALRPSPRPSGRTEQQATNVVQPAEDILPTPPAARTARLSSHHSTYIGEFQYVQDMKPSPTSSDAPSLSPSPTPRLEIILETNPPPAPSHPAFRCGGAPAITSRDPSSPPIPYNADGEPSPVLLLATVYSPTSPTPPQVPGGPIDPTMPVRLDHLDAEQRDDGTLMSQEGSILIQAPPPAYGRWRGSVRVDPDMLSWRGGLTLGEVEGKDLPEYDDDAEETQARKDQ